MVPSRAQSKVGGSLPRTRRGSGGRSKPPLIRFHVRISPTSEGVGPLRTRLDVTSVDLQIRPINGASVRDDRGCSCGEWTVTSLPVVIDGKLACADRLMPRMRPRCFRPPNGLEVNPRDAVRCAAGRAARRLPRLTSRRRERVASGVTPCVSQRSRRLGRRARHPASRRVLPRVSRRRVDDVAV